MAALRHERVTALPAQTVPNTIYYVRAPSASYVTEYITGNDGIAYPVGGSPAPTPTLDTTPGSSTLSAMQVQGAVPAFDAIDARLEALGV